MTEPIVENVDNTPIDNEESALDTFRLDTLNKFPIIIKECFGIFSNYDYYDNDILFEDIIKSFRKIFNIPTDIIFDIIVGGTEDMEYSNDIVTTVEKIKNNKIFYIRYKKYTNTECLNCHKIKYEIKKWNVLCQHLYCGECFMKCRKIFSKCPYCI